MFLILLCILPLMVPTLAELQTYTPEDHITLNCGLSETELLFNGQKWSPKNLSQKIDAGVSRVSINDNDEPESPKIHACIFKNEFTYTFPVSSSSVSIQLHFYFTTYFGFNLSKGLFSITAGPYTLLRTSESTYSGDVDQFVGYTVREFIMNVNGPALNVTFRPSVNISDSYSFVNKIEITSVAPNLYIRPDVPLPLVGQPTKWFSGNNTALETMHRVNIGGPSISADEDDIGMFLPWADENGYLISGDLSTAVHARSDIKYSSSVPAYTAPREVYATARVMQCKSPVNLTWSFPLDPGFSYLVRLHFFEIRSSDQPPYVFQVYINSKIAEEHACLREWTNRTGVPAYRDYIVNTSAHNRDIPFIDSILLLELNSHVEGSAILNGLEIFKLSNHKNGLAGVHPFGFGKFASYREPKQARKVAIAVFSALSGLVLIVIGCFIFLHSATGRFAALVLSYPKLHRATFMKWAPSDYCQYFSLTDLITATDNFSDANVLGKGGFGKVYKGSVNGGATVAIKRGSPTSNQGLQEFQTEITMLSKLRHRHLVSLIGYCMDNNEMILVYDYLHHGTLRDYLYGTSRRRLSKRLEWKQRLEICIGAAKGIHYLHEGTKQMIIHRDVKSTNILLDKKWVAKVADFGLSRCSMDTVTSENTHISTMVKGTFGYLDPEYYRRQKLTEKSDVYSFGVLLFEMVCARPAVLPMVTGREDEILEQANLAEWALSSLVKGTFHETIDPFLRGKIDPESLITFTGIAVKCLADKGNERPSMGHVIWNLELALRHQESSTDTCGNEDVNVDADVMVIGIEKRKSDATPGIEFSELLHPTGR